MQFELIESGEELLEGFCVFIEIYIHQILFIRQLYPRKLFENRTEFGMSVQYCNHPSVVDFVKRAVESINPLLGLNAVEKIFISVFSKNRIEQFILSFKWLVEFSLKKDPIYIPRFEIEDIFRDFLSKIKTSEGALGPVPKDATFELAIKAWKTIKFRRSTKLIKCEAPRKYCGFSGSLRVLKDYTSSLFQMQLVVEENNKEPVV